MGAVTTDDRLNHEHIAAARWAAEALTADGVARVRLTPGDMTEYRILIAAPAVEWADGARRAGRYFWVALCAGFGAGYEWHGGAVDPYYARDKWTNDGSGKGVREHTAVVMSRFLTALAEAMAELAAKGTAQPKVILRGRIVACGPWGDGGAVDLTVVGAIVDPDQEIRVGLDGTQVVVTEVVG